jgi:hypothetical protein
MMLVGKNKKGETPSRQCHATLHHWQCPDPCHVIVVGEVGRSVEHLRHVVIGEEATNSRCPYVGHHLTPPLHTLEEDSEGDHPCT